MATGSTPYIVIPEQRIPVIREVDVLVCGGGPAGVCAAVAAARMGARVLIAERHGCFGGMATSAAVTIWHSLYGMDLETQVIHGLPVEIIERLSARGATRNQRADGRGPFTIDTEVAKLVLDGLLREADVTPLLHCWVADVALAGDRVDAVVVENKSGRQAIRARVVIDATGDGDVAARAGLPFEKGDAQGLMQPPTLCFRVAGIDMERAQREGFSKMGQVLNRPMDYNGQEYPNFLWHSRSTFRPDEMMLAGVRVTEVDSTDAWSLTRAEMEGRQQLEWVMRQLTTQVPGFEKATLVDIAAQIGIRESRHVRGLHVLQEQEVLDGVRFPDAIAQGTYPVDIHNPTRRGILFKYLDGRTREIRQDGSTVQGFWSPDGKERDTLCYQVPYRSLVPVRVSNILLSGRCISATHEAHGAIRVMVNCMQTGQAAGVAAALCAQVGIASADLETAALHRALAGQGCSFLA